MRTTKPWADTWMGQARRFAGERSKDPNTQVGCVIVSSDKVPLVIGYNGVPRGVEDLGTRYAREPLSPAGRRPKDLWVRHAEENAVSNAAMIGARLAGATAYVTHHPCSRCAGALINAGIACVVVGDGTTAMPEEEFIVAATMFNEAGVRVEFHPDPALAS